MNRRKWLWVALLGLPVAVAGGLTYANAQKAGSYICPLTGEELPCEKCCPLNGEGRAVGEQQTGELPYTCPITGEELACPNCCPLNQKE